MTLQQLAQEVRDLSKEPLKVDPSQPQVTVNGKPIRSYLSKLADRIDELASSAYNRIDIEVCGIEDASHFDIDDVRSIMEETLGDYYE
jgi:methylaspartate ammonia-lyase